jgi:signal recognition particle subunit SRP54
VITQLVKQFEMMKPLMQGMASGGMADRAKMLQQLQTGAMMGDLGMGGLGALRTKKSTGKRLNNDERNKLRKQREKELRQAKRKGR